MMLDNGIKAVTDEALADSATDYIVGFRKITGTIGMRLRRDMQKFFTRRKDFGTHTLVVTIGASGGRQYKLNMPQTELDYSQQLSYASDGEVVVSLPYEAKESTTTSADALDLTIL